MRRSLGKGFSVLLAMLMVGVLTTEPSFASGATVDWITNNGSDCNSFYISFQTTVPDGTHLAIVDVYSPRTSTTSSVGGILLFLGPGSGIYGVGGLAPAGSLPGDTWQVTVTITHPITVDDSATISYKCAPGLNLALDDRINWDAFSGPVALYCDGTVLKVYDIDPKTGDGSLAFAADGNYATLPVNGLIKAKGDIELWHLSTGEFQVNADAGEGKTYAFIFNGCPYDGNGYNANIDPNG